MLLRILAEQKNRRAEVVVVNRLVGIQGDGFGVIVERLGHRAVMAVVIGEVVPDRGFAGVNFARQLQLRYRALLLMDVIEKTRVGNAGPDVIGVLLEKGFRSLCARAQSVQGCAGSRLRAKRRALGGEVLIVADPFVHLRLRHVVSRPSTGDIRFSTGSLGFGAAGAALVRLREQVRGRPRVDSWRSARSTRPREDCSRAEIISSAAAKSSGKRKATGQNKTPCRLGEPAGRALK